MKTFRIFFFLLIAVSSFSFASAQKRFPTTEGVTMSQFNGSFSILFDQNDARKFYAVNMSSFTDEAAAKHFQQAVFKDGQLVSVSVPENGIWYLSASAQVSPSDIQDKITLLKDQANGFAATLTTDTRNAYLSGNSK